MIRKSLILIVIILTTFQVLNSETLKLLFNNKYRVCNEYYKNIKPIYKLDFDTLDNGKRLIPIKLPDMSIYSDTAFKKLFFEGLDKSAMPRNIYVLIGNYSQEKTSFWVDLNGNLDFTDDNAYYELGSDSIYIELYNESNSNGKFVYKIHRLTDIKKEVRERTIQYLANDNPENGFLTHEFDYWLMEQRMNILSCDTIIDNQKVQIGLMDWDCNGLYDDIDTISPDNFGCDRVLVGEYGAQLISYKITEGAVQVMPETKVEINGVVFRVKEIEPSGKYMLIERTDEALENIKIGDVIPDYKLTLLNGKEKKLSGLIVPGKYNLIDMWAVWCKGCVATVPELKKIAEEHKDKLEIISLHDWRVDKEQVKKFVDTKKMNWTNGMLTPEISKGLLSGGGYYYYVLVDPEGKILKFGPMLDDVKEILKN